MIANPEFALPDPFLLNAGGRVGSAAQWTEHKRQEISDAIVPVAYGPWPRMPVSTRAVELHRATARNLQGARLLSVRVETDGQHAFMLRIFVPHSVAGPCPVVLNGDGCWHYATDEVVCAVLQRGFIFAQFNRVELASDVAGSGAVQRFSSVLGAPPVRALAAWAWGYQRAVDALLQLDVVDAAHIAVVGHSRGGKAALLAGAMDPRIALTSANNSGAGGGGCFRWQGAGSETLGDIVSVFPHWFGPQLARYAGREQDLPFDQHYLKALVAPRALLTTEAVDDLWANPAGSWQTHRAAREVYALLGVPDRIAIAFRKGGHTHSSQDWRTLLDFCDTVFRGAPVAATLGHHDHPFMDLPPAFAWRHAAGAL